MNETYIIVAIISLAVIFVFMVITKKVKPAVDFSSLSGLSFAFVIAGIIFGEKLLAYILMGIGVLLAIFDIIRRMRR